MWTSAVMVASPSECDFLIGVGHIPVDTINQ